MGQRIRLLIADDHPFVRKALARVLGDHPEFEVVGVAEDGQMAVELAEKLRPQVVIMDFSMPLLNGEQATQQIVACCPEVKVIGYSMHDGPVATSMLEAGAFVFLSKGCDTSLLIETIHESVATDGDPP